MNGRRSVLAIGCGGRASRLVAARRRGQSGVDAAPQALAGSQPAEEVEQLFAFGGLEGGAEALLVLHGDLARAVECRAAVGREVEGVRAPVLRVAPPFHQPLFLELIDDRDETARWNAEGLGHPALRDALGVGDEVQNTELARIETEGGQRVLEGPAPYEAEAGEQEDGAAAGRALGRRADARARSANGVHAKSYHIRIVAETNRSLLESSVGGVGIPTGPEQEVETMTISTTIEQIVTVAARAEAATKVYGKGETAVRALDAVDVSFEGGRFTAIMGPSGSGKSTLLHCLAGLDDLTAGRVFLGDVEVGALSDKRLTELRRDRIGFVFQAYNLIPTLDVFENVALPTRLAGRAPDPAWLDTVIDTVQLRDRLRHRPSELSGGQQQRVAVARALATRPEIVFADEPTGNLDSRSSAEILEFMSRAVHDLDQTIVMVTHDPSAAAYADRVVFLADGRVVGELLDPTAEAVLDRVRVLGG
jgi:putative ABC transport system ATP-binding protein